MGRKKKRKTRIEQGKGIGEQKTADFEQGSASNKKQGLRGDKRAVMYIVSRLQRATSISEEDIYVLGSELHTASRDEQSARTCSNQRMTRVEKREATIGP